MNKRKILNKALNEILKKLKKLEKKKSSDGNTIMRKPIEYLQEIITQSPYKIISHAGRIWIYYEGYYIAIESKAKAENFIKECVMRFDSISFVQAGLVASILNELFLQYYELYPYENHDITYINMFSNVLAIDRNGKIELLEHEEKYNFTYKLPYDYDPNAKSPVFDKFLQTSLKDEDIQKVLFEYLGYILNTNAKNHEKAFFAYGDGSNGKSTLINIIKALYGKENISVVELTEMGDMQKCALMDGKLLNISSDAKKSGLDTSAFKKIVSGEPVLGKYLFKDIYTIENLPKIFVAMNKLPFHNGDNSFGFYRRLLLVPFNQTIKEEDKDYDLESKVITNELPAILNYAIEGIQRLTLQGSFTETQSMKEVMNSYKEAGSHVLSFLEEEQYEAVDSSLKQGTALTDIYKDFKNWCLALGYNPYSATYLSSELDHLGFIKYKNSTKHYRLVKMKLKNQTGFTSIESPYHVSEEDSESLPHTDKDKNFYSKK